MKKFPTMIKNLLFASIFGLVAGGVAAATQSMDHIAEKYVKLVLALGNHDSGYVDAYYGPKEWAEEVKGWDKSPQQIATLAQQLRQALPKPIKQADENLRLRLHYLDRQLVAVVAHAKALATGKRASFDEQSNQLYDTEAPHFNFSDFDPVLEQLARLLPGKGELSERVQAFKQQFIIPANKLDVVFQRAIQECRDRTKVYIPLLENETFTLEYVQDKPWSGYNWYQGNGFSLIQMNTELPIEISRAVDLGCHEGYPGHHTYNALLEDNLVKQRGWVEFSVYPLYSPQSLIAEGSANYGIELAFPENEKAQFEKDVLFPLAGLNPNLAEKYEALAAISAKLNYAGNEIARLYLNAEIDKDEAVALLQKYSVNSKEKAEQRVRFFDSYGAYVINYNWGKDMVKQYVEQATTQPERWQRFKKLLSSPMLPSSLNW